jgi:hypothetical protein
MARQFLQLPEEQSELVAQIASAGITPAKTSRRVEESTLAPSGSTLVNLACTDNPNGAWMLGGLVTIPGESAAGKTILALTTLAECTYLPRFDDYLLIHDDAEERMAFDLKYLFSERVHNRVVGPPLGNSKTIQSFQANCLTLKKQKKKYIYVLDSLDSLASDEELEKEMLRALALAKSKEAADKIAGSYGMEKAKVAGQILRMINNDLKESNSLLIITQQLRENVGGGMFDPEYITSGGQAPFYYSNHQLWMLKGAQHKRKELVIGGHTRCRVEKNSATGKRRRVEFDLWNDMGIDDVGSCVDWMVDQGFWRERTINTVKGIAATELDLFLPSKNKLIAAIEDGCLEVPMRAAVGDAWRKLEDSVLLGRKSRYL